MSPTAAKKVRDGKSECLRDPTDHRRPAARTNRAAQDTAAGCRIRADADLLAAVATSTDNQRRRLETSAASWAARAVLLQAMDDDLEARKSRVHARSETNAEVNYGG